MHQIAWIYIVIPQQKWNYTYLENTYKLEEGRMLQTSVFNSIQFWKWNVMVDSIKDLL